MRDSIIAAVAAAGFSVYMRDKSDTWLIFADGQNQRLAHREGPRAVTAPSPFPPPDSPARRPPLTRETAIRAGIEPEPDLPPWASVVVEVVRLASCFLAAGAVVYACAAWMSR